MTELKSIGVMSLAKLQGAINFVFGLIGGIGALIARSGFWTFIWMPIAGAIGGFIAGAVTAFFYNIFASQVGGIQLRLGKR